MVSAGERARGDGRFRADAAALLVLAAIGALALLQSYGRWIDPIIDIGRDLYIPEQLRHGARLYASFSYLYPPLAPYLLALITAVTGASLTSYTAIGVGVSAAVAATIYLASRRVAGPLAGFSAALLFLTLNFTGATSWGCNFLFPYAHAATLGMLFFLLLELQLLRSARLFAVVFAVLDTWSKLEFAVATVLMLLVAMILRRIRWTDFVAYAVANLLIYAALDLWLFADTPHWFRENVLAPSLLGGSVARDFYRQVTGIASLGTNLRKSVEGFLILGGAIVLLRFVDRPWRKALANGAPASAGVKKAPAEAGAPFTALLFVVLGVLFLLLTADNRFFRAWAIAQIVLVPFAIRDRSLPLPLLLLASLLMSSRIFLRISPDWYGFVYILPTYVLIAYVLIRYLPERGIYSAGVARAWLALFVLIGARGLYQQNVMYGFKSAAVETQRGTYLDLPHRAEVVESFSRWIATRPDLRTLVAIPEGLTLNYFIRRPTSLRLHTFTPAEMPDAAAERETVAAFLSSPPDAVALVTRNVSEFGSRGFGIDYGREFARVIAERYEPAGRWQSGSFWIVVLTRRAPVSSG